MSAIVRCNLQEVEKCSVCWIRRLSPSAVVRYNPHTVVGKIVGKAMPVQGKLSDLKARSKLKQGRHADGSGLYLNVSAAGTKSWIFLWMKSGKRREMGLGPYPAVSLASARSKAVLCRQAVADGRDPIAERDKDAEPTFGECADQFLESMRSGWRNTKHAAQWKMTLDVYCAPIRARRVSTISTHDVLGVLTPIWGEKAETASRLRGRIERVLDYARAKGWRSDTNPALWRGHLRSILPPRQKLQQGHHAAMPYSDVPPFVARLQDSSAMSARALEFLILTAARSGEVLDAAWSEIDFKSAVWTVPALRMKAGKEHRVPLCGRAIAILTDLAETKANEYVFPGERPGRPLSNMAFHMLLRRMGLASVTPHGFRSSFRDWCGDATGYPREVAEAALAHKVGDETERAYRRSDALHKRSMLMQSWADYVGVVTADSVTPFRRRTTRNTVQKVTIS